MVGCLAFAVASAELSAKGYTSILWTVFVLEIAIFFSPVLKV
jgi:hypothetical protein